RPPTCAGSAASHSSAPVTQPPDPTKVDPLRPDCLRPHLPSLRTLLLTFPTLGDGPVHGRGRRAGDSGGPPDRRQPALAKRSLDVRPPPRSPSRVRIGENPAAVVPRRPTARIVGHERPAVLASVPVRPPPGAHAGPNPNLTVRGPTPRKNVK